MNRLDYNLPFIDIWLYDLMKYTKCQIKNVQYQNFIYCT